MRLRPAYADRSDVRRPRSTRRARDFSLVRRTGWPVAVAVAVAALLLAASVQPAGAATSGPNGYPGLWGLYAPDFPGTLTTVTALQTEVGRSANYVMWYVHWRVPYNTLN